MGENIMSEEQIIKTWKEDFCEGEYFIILRNGDAIGYDMSREEFSLNNYWNVIDDETVNHLIKKYGIED